MLRFAKLISTSNMAVQNGEMLAAISEKLLIHYSEDTGERNQGENLENFLSTNFLVSEMTLPLQAPDHVAHIHLSRTGFHAIVSSKLGFNFYVHLKSNTVHQLKKIKCVVTAVGWNPEYTRETETGPILLGTSMGSVIELNVTSTGMLTMCKELTQKFSQTSDQRTVISPSPGSAISDMQLFVLAEDDNQKAKKWMAIISQMSRLDVLITEMEAPPVVKTGGFTSSASLQAGLMNLGTETAPTTVFHSFFSSINTQHHSLNSSKFSEKFKNHGFLTLHPTISEPKQYAWLSPDGISIGKVDIYAERVQDVLVEQFNIE